MAPVRHRWQCLPFLFHIVLCSSRGTLSKIIPLFANSRRHCHINRYQAHESRNVTSMPQHLRFSTHQMTRPDNV
jgi:hypothetical protein